MRSIFLFVVLVVAYACNPPTASEYMPTYSDTGNVELLDVDLELVAGNLNGNDQFIEVGLPLEVSESYDLVPTQVGAIIPELMGHDPDYLRIEFVSDHVEWVGYSHGSIGIYDSEEDCLEYEDYCDKVVVGEGTSGYFAVEGGHMAIQNVYCRYAPESYEFAVTAKVYDLTFWPVEEISDPAEIIISCQMID